nr:MAG TPA: hypothetical protein [Caudoviricetes sp.]DAM00472.1 MAG TPA: hypothetical protein [Bacteriophage sp.]DAM50556.1 MAG TPA: hypothetical protein [Caudoviricetes sp.]DAY97010.1 MAG TPA: hypothetical protein [Caudoviricetes sp.]
MLRKQNLNLNNREVIFWHHKIKQKILDYANSVMMIFQIGEQITQETWTR